MFLNKRIIVKFDTVCKIIVSVVPPEALVLL